MKTFMLLACVFATAYGCGEPTYPPVLSRVVGGEDARPHSWPWQVSLQMSSGGTWSHVCGGTLLSAQWVLTAAHCITDGHLYRVELGRHNLKAEEEGSVTARVEDIITHDDFQPLFARNDIALVKLSPVTFSDTIMPACLPDQDAILPHGTSCYVTGWGRLSTSGPVSDILQQALLPVVDHETCTQKDWWNFQALESMVCAGGDGITSACNGDSGGPLNCRSPDGSWEVHGAYSFGPGKGCNVFKKPSVFTRISAFTGWINNVMATN